MSSSGIDAVPNLPKFTVPVLMPHRTYKVPGTGIDVVPKLPKCPVPVIPPVCLGTHRTEHKLGNNVQISFNSAGGSTQKKGTWLKSCLRPIRRILPIRPIKHMLRKRPRLVLVSHHTVKTRVREVRGSFSSMSTAHTPHFIFRCSHNRGN